MIRIRVPIEKYRYGYGFPVVEVRLSYHHASIWIMLRHQTSGNGCCNRVATYTATETATETGTGTDTRIDTCTDMDTPLGSYAEGVSL